MRKIDLCLAYLVLFSAFHPSSQAQLSMKLQIGKAEKPVIGLPFSADATVHVFYHLANGMAVDREVKGHIYRSADGVERYEGTYPSTKPDHPDPVTLAYIVDQTKRTSIALNEDLKTAVRQNLPPVATVTVTLLGLPATPSSGRLKLTDVTTTDLGKNTLEMWKLVGRLISAKIPAGAVGNDQPLLTTAEIWAAPQLKILVKEIEKNPLTGNRTFQLTNIRAGDPDPTLFQIPAGYKITDRAPVPTTQAEIQALNSGHPEQRTQQIEDALNSSDPILKNTVAFGLALNGDHLADAQKLAEQAVQLQEKTDADSVSMQEKVKSFDQMGILGADWETLGWVYYRQGRIDDAENYTHAAWELKPRNAQICLHMGIIYEAQHHSEEAINFYRMALNARIPPTMQDFIQTHLDRLGATSSDPLPMEVTKSLPSVDLPAGLGDTTPLVDILLTHNAVPTVAFLQGDPQSSAALIPAIKSAVAEDLPDTGPEKLLRRARIVCSNGETHACTLHFLGSEVARNDSAGNPQRN